MKEIWKDIIGYEGLYQVSNLGRIKSLKRKTISRNGNTKYLKSEKERILKTVNDNNGYVIVYLCNNGKNKMIRVHRLVAKTFIPNPEMKPVVNHINGIKNDNRLENLEWTTYQENIIHAYKTGLKVTTKKQIESSIKNILIACEKNKVKVDQFDLNGNYIKTWNSIQEASSFYNLSCSSGIIKCCKGKQKTAGNYIWKYAKKNKNSIVIHYRFKQQSC